MITSQDFDDLIILQSRALKYYNQGDYSNAIILYEDLLAKQELLHGKGDIHVAETLNQLGELYLLIDLPDIANYYFNEAIIIFQNTFQTGKYSLEKSLQNLLKIYTLQNDTIIMQNIENQLKSVSTINYPTNDVYPKLLSDQHTLTPKEEDLAFDMMSLGLSYLEYGLYSEATVQFNKALNSQTVNLVYSQTYSIFFPIIEYYPHFDKYLFSSYLPYYF